MFYDLIIVVVLMNLSYLKVCTASPLVVSNAWLSRLCMSVSCMSSFHSICCLTLLDFYLLCHVFACRVFSMVRPPLQYEMTFFGFFTVLAIFSNFWSVWSLLNVYTTMLHQVMALISGVVDQCRRVRILQNETGSSHERS